MKYWKQSVKILIGIWVCAVIGLADPVAAEMLDTVVAKVDKEIITLSSVLERVRILMVRSQGSQVPLPEIDELKKSLLEGMVREKLILGVVERIGLSVDEKEIQAALDDIQRRGALSDKHLQMMLEMEGKTLEEYKDEIRDQLLVAKVVNFQVRSRIKVDKEEIKNYYDAHIKDFWQPSKVHARHILFIMNGPLTDEQKSIKEEKAREALKKIRSGEDFIEVAKTYSEDVTAQAGGDLGVLEKGKMIPEFEKAVFSLKEGEVSSLVESPYGLHIIRVDKIHPGDTRPLEEVEDDIVGQVRESKYNQAYEDYIATLKKEAFIELKWDVLIPPKSKNKTVEAKEKTKTPPQSLAKKKTHPPKHKQKVEILPPLEVGQNIKPPKPPSADPKLKHLEKQLKYFRNLRDMGIITEEEYLGRKRELLDNL